MKPFVSALISSVVLACGQSLPPAEQPVAPATPSASPSAAPSAPASGGLGLIGVGEGAGGRGEGIGLGNVGNIGNIDAGTAGGTSAKKPPIRQGATQVIGRLPPEVIQRIVRQNYGDLRKCYETGLAKDPSLTGRVTTKFVIDRAGAVSSVQDGGSDIPDATVVTCVLGVFGGLKFPQPEGGIVTVVYPIVFSPAD
jgi:hypothetical protein